jgi:hypothetical protein
LLFYNKFSNEKVTPKNLIPEGKLGAFTILPVFIRVCHRNRNNRVHVQREQKAFNDVTHAIVKTDLGLKNPQDRF